MANSTNIVFSLDDGNFPEKLREAASKINRMTMGAKNPFEKSLREYQLEMLRRLSTERPTVGVNGSFLGNTWPRLKDQYTRKTDGVTVPVWGGVPHVVMPGGFGAEGAFSPLGVVRQARRDKKTGRWLSIRRGLPRKYSRAGYGVVKLGQVFSQEHVLGRLKTNGWRYKESDLQLGTIEANTLLADWVVNPPYTAQDGLSSRVSTNKPYANRVYAKRPWHGPAMDEFLARRMVANVTQYILDVFPEALA